MRRFATAKKLCAYTGLSPRQTQSGNDARDHEKGIG
ncbi:MAG: transposase [Opitutaceae bacterium]|nr:transposase [Opitutaceae bacterium]